MTCLKNIIFILIVFLLLIIIIKNKKETFSNYAYLNIDNNHKNIDTSINKINTKINKTRKIKNNGLKISIASMVTKHPDFDLWLEYHLNTLRIDHIFLRVEDSPEYKKFIDKYEGRITATYHTKNDIDMKHNYLTIMDRQKELVNTSLDKARNLGMDVLFHTDADELIYVKSENKEKAHFKIREYLKEAIKNNSDLGCIHFKNFEAVFPNNREKCFNTNKFIDCKKGKCLSYANGKSCGIVNNGARFRGPHYFTGKVYNMPDDKMAVLHFDSCTYNQWFTKFNLLKDTNEEKMKKIPFPFYKNSIRKLKDCHKSKTINKYKNDNDITQKCTTNLNKYFKEQKIEPYYKYNNLREFNTFF